MKKAVPGSQKPETRNEESGEAPVGRRRPPRPSARRSPARVPTGTFRAPSDAAEPGAPANESASLPTRDAATPKNGASLEQPTTKPAATPLVAPPSAEASSDSLPPSTPTAYDRHGVSSFLKSPAVRLPSVPLQFGSVGTPHSVSLQKTFPTRKKLAVKHCPNRYSATKSKLGKSVRKPCSTSVDGSGLCLPSTPASPKCSSLALARYKLQRVKRRITPPKTRIFFGCPSNLCPTTGSRQMIMPNYRPVPSRRDGMSHRFMRSLRAAGCASGACPDAEDTRSGCHRSLARTPPPPSKQLPPVALDRSSHAFPALSVVYTAACEAPAPDLATTKCSCSTCRSPSPRLLRRATSTPSVTAPSPLAPAPYSSTTCLLGTARPATDNDYSRANGSSRLFPAGGSSVFTTMMAVTGGANEKKKAGGASEAKKTRFPDHANAIPRTTPATTDHSSDPTMDCVFAPPPPVAKDKEKNTAPHDGEGASPEAGASGQPTRERTTSPQSLPSGIHPPATCPAQGLGANAQQQTQFPLNVYALTPISLPPFLPQLPNTFACTIYPTTSNTVTPAQSMNTSAFLSSAPIQCSPNAIATASTVQPIQYASHCPGQRLVPSAPFDRGCGAPPVSSSLLPATYALPPAPCPASPMLYCAAPRDYGAQSTVRTNSESSLSTTRSSSAEEPPKPAKPRASKRASRRKSVKRDSAAQNPPENELPPARNSVNHRCAPFSPCSVQPAGSNVCVRCPGVANHCKLCPGQSVVSSSQFTTPQCPPRTSQFPATYPAHSPLSTEATPTNTPGRYTSAYCAGAPTHPTAMKLPSPPNQPSSIFPIPSAPSVCSALSSPPTPLAPHKFERSPSAGALCPSFSAAPSQQLIYEAEWRREATTQEAPLGSPDERCATFVQASPSAAISASSIASAGAIYSMQKAPRPCSYPVCPAGRNSGLTCPSEWCAYAHCQPSLFQQRQWNGFRQSTTTPSLLPKGIWVSQSRASRTSPSENCASENRVFESSVSGNAPSSSHQPGASPTPTNPSGPCVLQDCASKKDKSGECPSMGCFYLPCTATKGKRTNTLAFVGSSTSQPSAQDEPEAQESTEAPADKKHRCEPKHKEKEKENEQQDEEQEKERERACRQSALARALAEHVLDDDYAPRGEEAGRRSLARSLAQSVLQESDAAPPTRSQQRPAAPLAKPCGSFTCPATKNPQFACPSKSCLSATCGPQSGFSAERTYARAQPAPTPCSACRAANCPAATYDFLTCPSAACAAASCGPAPGGCPAKAACPTPSFGSLAPPYASVPACPAAEISPSLQGASECGQQPNAADVSRVIRGRRDCPAGQSACPSSVCPSSSWRSADCLYADARVPASSPQSSGVCPQTPCARGGAVADVLGLRSPSVANTATLPPAAVATVPAARPPPQPAPAATRRSRLSDVPSVTSVSSDGAAPAKRQCSSVVGARVSASQRPSFPAQRPSFPAQRPSVPGQSPGRPSVQRRSTQQRRAPRTAEQPAL